MKKMILKIRLLIISIWLLFAVKKEDKKIFKPTRRLNLQFFADPADPPAGGDPQDPSPEDKKFSQDEVNKIVQDRLSRAEKKAQKELAKSMGFESVEEMQAALNKDKDKDKKQDKDKDPVDIEKLLEEKLKDERQKTFKRLVTSEVKVLANELGFADWEDALALADLSEVKEDEKGNIAGVKEALEALAKKKPHLLKQQSSNGVFGAAIPNNGGGQGTQKNLEEIKKMAQSRGVTQTQAYNPWA
ncbi:scaffolding protein [Caldibacillus lycopersici]|uniref:Scaffolding protein n=1 Tax=Perspicuibacillus lycopersici TaxID=1325689 RepID=A0AAE3IT20_9BACI|nr:scaffolding protein [Perspicuibacillus lycopersici]MCU9614090.1 scaffolding protein [Perspicuibacillus lycopersici]